MTARAGPPPRAAALLALSSVTWPAGLPLLILFLGYLIFRRAGWRAIVTGLAAAAIPLVMYLAWFDAYYHSVAFNESDGIFLWSRDHDICRLRGHPAPGGRGGAVPAAAGGTAPGRPELHLGGELAAEGAARAEVLPRPQRAGDELRAAGHRRPAGRRTPGPWLDGFWLTFSWRRPDRRSALHSEKYQFAFATRTWASAATSRELAADQRYYTGAATPARAVPPYARWMAGYQRFGFLRGPLLGAALLAGLAGIAGRAGGGFRRLRGWGGPALFPWTAAMVMLIVPNVTASFSIRYVVPAQAVACLAAGLAFARPWRGAGQQPAAAPAAEAAAPAAQRRRARPPAARRARPGAGPAIRPDGARLTGGGRFLRFPDRSAPVSDGLALESITMTETGSPLPLLSRYAIMIDVGYIYASAGELLFSAGVPARVPGGRGQADPGADPARRASRSGASCCGCTGTTRPGTGCPPSTSGSSPRCRWVKLRLGNLNARGQQKGVDAQIRADMEALARHRAITDAVLVAGDEDMVPAVEAAQAYGVRVHLWGVEPPYGTNQAERLVWESDTVQVLERAFLEPYFSKHRSPPIRRAGHGRAGQS